MSIILGIDPGSRVTGFGLIRQQGNKVTYINSGCVRTTGEDFNARLGEIYLGVEKIVSTYKPDFVAIERVFVMKNVESALKLGQARGAAISACVVAGLEIGEYSPTQVKRTIVGVGRAGKEQVQHMVTRLLQLSDTPPSDAADALAIALCHVQHAGVRRLESVV